MKFEQVINSTTGEVDPNTVVLVNDDGYRAMAFADPNSTLWQAYLAWIALGNTAVLPANATLDNTKAVLMESIDAKVAAVYSTWMRFQAEYEAREAAAQAFKDANYTGDAGIWITGFATAAGLTPQAAADRILVQSVSLRGALEGLGALRMRKYEVLSATDEDAARQRRDAIFTAIDTLATAIQ
jgi:hypothetical protein